MLVAILYLIQCKLKIFIHSFISSRLPCPHEWFQVKLFWRNYSEKLHFRIKLFFLAIVLRCWNPVEYIQQIYNLIFYCSAWWNDLWSEIYKSVQNPDPAICRCCARFLLNSQKKYLCRGLFLNKVASELDKILWATFFYTYGPLLLKMKDFAHFNFYSFKIYNKGN